MRSRRRKISTRKPSFWRVISKRITLLRHQEEEVHRERLILERTLAELEAKETPIATVSRPPEHIGRNAIVIGTILSRAGKPLAIKDVAQIAYEQKVISSDKKGRRGVYNIVNNVMRRNSKNGSAMFVKLDHGNLWDLRERHSQRSAEGH